MTDVTIITPFYNTQDYLHRNIKSVLSQKGVSIKHILIDDGSTDNSSRIAKMYEASDNRVQVISQENKGQGPARNRALDIADSEFVYFVDSDDSLGNNTLIKLVEASRKNNLDLCSPYVPSRYFNKRLELTPCVPCKSQFLRLDIIKKFDIRQPDARSGQDGVFSHLFLTMANKIGIDKSAVFNYTAERPGSTFAKYKSLHSFVPSIIDTHFKTIINFYNEYDLWQKNSDRLLAFLAEETFQNRILPHYRRMNSELQEDCRKKIENIFRKAEPHIHIFNKVNDPYILFLKNFLRSGNIEKFCFPSLEKLPNKNFFRKSLKVVNFWDPSLSYNKKEKVSVVNKTSDKDHILVSKKKMKELENKLDYLINIVNNNSYMLASSLKSGLPKLKADSNDLIVSLTTMPSRIGSLDLVLTSILKQSILPSKILVWITNKIDRSYIPQSILEFENHGVEFRFVEDIGPHTKLIYALEEFSSKNIITFDDDIIYPSNTIKSLTDAHSKFPSSICANWARELAFDENGKVLGIRDGKLLTPPVRESDIEQKDTFEHKSFKLGFPYGTAGVLYPPNSFDEVVFDREIFKNICPKEDDIWFRACSLLKGTGVVCTNLGINPKHHCISGSQVEALRHHNHAQGGNKIQMRKVFEYFNLEKGSRT